MTTGQFLYSVDGKEYKVFGAHDSDGLKLLRSKLVIKFISADHRGFDISKKRIHDDMGYDIDLVSEEKRLEYISKYGYDKVIYMGDGYHDAPILKKCYYGIAPKNARPEAIKSADYVTDSNSGEGAVLDASLHILKSFNFD